MAQAALPANVVSATVTTVMAQPGSSSPNNTSVASIKVKSLTGIHKVHLSVVDGSNNNLFEQEYNARTNMAVSATGGYTLSLKFFTHIDLGANTVKVRFEDKDNNLGAAFTVTAN